MARGKPVKLVLCPFVKLPVRDVSDTQVEVPSNQDGRSVVTSQPLRRTDARTTVLCPAGLVRRGPRTGNAPHCADLILAYVDLAVRTGPGRLE